jgi:membrane protease YdiL (CAAX protease family)
MATAGIDIRKLASLSAAVILIEIFAATAGPHFIAHSMVITGAARTCQILAFLLVFFATDGNLSAVGIRRATVMRGLKRGLYWSAGFGLAAALAGVLIYSAGKDPMALIHGRLPTNATRITLLFLVGGIIGPIAEEIFFRGILYGYFRRWGVLPALVVSTGIFALVHLLIGPVQGFAVIQTVGGVVFAVSYELEKNLMVPITVHCLGNMAIFSLPLLG